MWVEVVVRRKVAKRTKGVQKCLANWLGKLANWNGENNPRFVRLLLRHSLFSAIRNVHFYALNWLLLHLDVLISKLTLVVPLSLSYFWESKTGYTIVCRSTCLWKRLKKRGFEMCGCSSLSSALCLLSHPASNAKWAIIFSPTDDAVTPFGMTTLVLLWGLHEVFRDVPIWLCAGNVSSFNPDYL